MEQHCMHKLLLYQDLIYGKRNKGQQKKCYKDSIKIHLIQSKMKSIEIDEYIKD